MVAYIDLDCRFDVLRLAQVLKLRIVSAYGNLLIIIDVFYSSIDFLGMQGWCCYLVLTYLLVVVR